MLPLEISTLAEHIRLARTPLQKQNAASDKITRVYIQTYVNLINIVLTLNKEA
jgi:hypothetical protein